VQPFCALALFQFQARLKFINSTAAYHTTALQNKITAASQLHNITSHSSPITSYVAFSVYL